MNDRQLNIVTKADEQTDIMTDMPITDINTSGTPDQAGITANGAQDRNGKTTSGNLDSVGTDALP